MSRWEQVHPCLPALGEPCGDCSRCNQPTGKRDDEQALWAALLAGEQPRYAGERLGIPPRRVEYLCNKWARKGVYDYGVSHDLGWPR